MTGEAQFIDMVRALARSDAARGLADDAAVLTVGGETLVLTHDMMVEGRHWPKGADPADVAWKLVAVNLSDLAAKGARPIGLLLGFTLGEEEWDRRFAEGLGEVLAEYDAPLLGGDTVGQGPAGGRTLGLTAIGRAGGRVPDRAGAKMGDALWLAGDIGDAMAGHEADAHDFPELAGAFHRPRPLVDEGAALGGHVHAMMDVSDGLLLDAARMAEASGLTVAIDGGAVPESGAFTRWAATLTGARRAEAMHTRLGWGDDYALIFAAPADYSPPVRATHVGRFVRRGAVPLLLDGKAPPEGLRLGYDHGG